MNTISRREFLRVSALATAGVAAAACAKAPEPTQAPAEATATQAPAAATATPKPAEATATPQPAVEGPGKEAPMLAEKVAAGTLPPVDERLPADPKVQPVEEEIGQYGGTWHRVAVGRAGDRRVGDRLTYQCPVRWKSATDVSEVVPHIVSSWEINDDATEFIFHLRAGHKWSDGEPFTTDDCVFWYEDVMLNTDLTPTFPWDRLDPATGQPMVLERLDDLSFKVTYASPYGLWLQFLAGPDGGLYVFQHYCKHYLSQYHPAYVDKADLDKMVADANFDNWWELFTDKGGQSYGRGKEDLGLPRVWQWIPVQMPPDIPLIDERNPYYFQTDPEGNQLPYIDQMVHEIVENADLANMKAVAGEIDMQLRHMLWTNYPLFVENAEKGDYRILEWELAEGSNCGIQINFGVKDPVLAELYANKDFRIALSIGINRDEINEIAYLGFGTPRQSSLSPGSPYYKEEHGTRWAEYDPDKANEILDGILPEKDGEGFRLRPDGERLTIVIEYAPIFGPWRDVLQMLNEQWKVIGIDAPIKEEDRSLLDERTAAGEQQMRVWTQDYNYTPLLSPHWFCPPVANNWSVGWNQWYASRGESGEEPPPEVKRQVELYWEIMGANPDQLPPLAQEFFDRASEELWVIGIVGMLPHIGVAKNNFRNVPEKGISDWLQLTPGNGAPEQWFFKQA